MTGPGSKQTEVGVKIKGQIKTSVIASAEAPKCIM